MINHEQQLSIVMGYESESYRWFACLLALVLIVVASANNGVLVACLAIALIALVAVDCRMLRVHGCNL